MFENLTDITLQHLNQLKLQTAAKSGKVPEHMQAVMDDIFKDIETRQGTNSQPIQVADLSSAQQLKELDAQDNPASRPILPTTVPSAPVPSQPYKLVPAVDERARAATLLEQDKARSAADALAKKNANRKLLGLPPLK